MWNKTHYLCPMMEKKKEFQTSLRLDEKEVAKLDELRRKEKDIPTRAEMMRRLIERAKL